MKLINKIKGILFDEEEIELPEINKEPVKTVKETSIVKEDDSIKEIKIPKDDFSDKNNYKSESTFTFPIDFDDEVEEVEPVRTRFEEKRESIRENTRRETKDFSQFLNKKEEKKHFKPTPIISPVYGILDQNYKKEDVIVKKDALRTFNELSLDEVRKRAFGTLEDDLESNLDKKEPKLVTKEKVKVEKEVIVEKPIVVEDKIDTSKTLEELINEDEKKLDIPEINSINESNDENNNNDTINIEEPKNSIDDLLSNESNENDNKNSEEIDDDEADLFSLIDSMYEEKGE